MKKAVSLVTAALLAAGLFTANVSADVEPPMDHGLDTSMLSDYDYARLRGKDITLNVANWGEYMSVNDEECLDVNNAFEQLTGITVNYKTYASNEELYSKLNSGGADYDIVIPSDYMISRMIKENMLRKLDYNNIPNFSYINEKYRNLEYDPQNEYSVPYMWGTVCIIYNKTMVDEEITSWSSLWDEKYAGNILMFNNPRDAFGIALTYAGYSQNTEDKNELTVAANMLKEQKKVVQAYVMDEIFDKMEGGSAAIAPYYAGDAVTMMAENSDLTWCLPTEGTNRFVDAACIPVNAVNVEAAEMYINFLCETEIAHANCDFVGYSTPHDGAYALLDDEVKNSPLQYPDEEYLNNKTEVFRNLSDDTNTLMQELWNEVKIRRTPVGWVILALLGVAVAATIIININRSRKKKRDEYDD